MKLLGPPVLENEEEKTLDIPEVIDEPIAPEEAVLDELGLNDPVETETPKPEPVAPVEPEKKDITDADLEPLNSKNQSTNERFQRLTEGFKQSKAQIEELSSENARYKESFNALQQLGFSDQSAAQDLIQFSQYRNALASGDMDTIKAIFAEQVRQVEMLTGKKLSVQASALDRFDDLRGKVENLDIDEDTAIELARHRSVQERAARDNQAQRQQQERNQQVETSILQAVDSVTALQSEWQRTDPDYAAILPYLHEDIEQVAKTFPPAQWASVIKQQYQTVKKALVKAQQSAPVQSVQPLRGNGRQAGSPAPSTAQEAVLSELGLDI